LTYIYLAFSLLSLLPTPSFKFPYFSNFKQIIYLGEKPFWLSKISTIKISSEKDDYDEAKLMTTLKNKRLIINVLLPEI